MAPVSYIYIFAHPSDPNVIKFGSTNNINRRINELNAGFYNTEDFYYCYATYETTPLVDKTLFELIDFLNKDLRVLPNREFYHLKAEDAFKILEYIARISNTSDKLFCYENPESENISDDPSQSDNVQSEFLTKLGKQSAILTFKNHNCQLNDYIIYGSSDSRKNGYWIDAPKRILENDWSLILEDFENKKLYLFNIRGKSIKEDSLRIRRDSKKPGYLTIEIDYNDNDFTEKRVDSQGNKLKFSRFKPITIDYNND